jgi:hypothetical protein
VVTVEGHGGDGHYPLDLRIQAQARNVFVDLSQVAGINHEGFYVGELSHQFRRHPKGREHLALLVVVSPVGHRHHLGAGILLQPQ